MAGADNHGVKIPGDTKLLLLQSFFVEFHHMALQLIKEIEDIWLFQCKIDFYFTEWTPKVVFSRVAEPRVKI